MLKWQDIERGENEIAKLHTIENAKEGWGSKGMEMKMGLKFNGRLR